MFPLFSVARAFPYVTDKFLWTFWCRWILSICVFPQICGFHCCADVYQFFSPESLVSSERIYGKLLLKLLSLLRWGVPYYFQYQKEILLSFLTVSMKANLDSKIATFSEEWWLSRLLVLLRKVCFFPSLNRNQKSSCFLKPGLFFETEWMRMGLLIPR